VRYTYLLLLVVLIGCLSALPVRAENLSDSGNAFVRRCSSIDKPAGELTDLESLHTAACATYVMGLDDGIETELALLRIERKTEVAGPYCYHGGIEGLEQGQIVRILLKYIRNNQEKADAPVPILFVWAMQKAFPPCSERK
jgi:Ssp1 endopeptidase immunity protein Rap1a